MRSALLLLILGVLGAFIACRPPMPWALYVSLKHAWYGPSLEPLVQAPGKERLQALYVELGVFDPVGQRFTDFQGALDVAPDRLESPQTQALGALASHIKASIHPDTKTLGWVYLSRRPRPLDGQSGETSQAAASSPPFSLYDPRHRRALVQTLKHVQALGLAGVQLDLEPFPVADVAAMQLLLGELRAGLGATFFLSVFVPKFIPEGRAEGAHPGFVWTSVLPFQALVNLSDQIVVPLYDYGSLAATREAYTARIAEVEHGLLSAIEPRERVWLALPTFRPSSEHGSAEDLMTAARAIRRFVYMPGGVAIFVFTGDERDFVPARDLADAPF